MKQNIPDEAEVLETLGIPADCDLGHEHSMHHAMRDLGLQHTQIPEKV